MAKTSSGAKNRWNSKTYRRIMVNMRKEEDADLLRYFDQIKLQIGPTDIFRRGLESLKKEGI